MSLTVLTTGAAIAMACDTLQGFLIAGAVLRGANALEKFDIAETNQAAQEALNEYRNGIDYIPPQLYDKKETEEEFGYPNITRLYLEKQKKLKR